MKKLTTKLLMSIIAVAFAFVALGTSTYAWFSMNTSVTATGMQITAKSDSTFLLIGSEDDGNTTKDLIQTAKKVTTAITVAAADSEVYPASHDAIANTSDADTAASWYYEQAANPGASTAKDGTKTALTSTNIGDYVIHKTIYVTLAKESNDAYALKVAATFASNGAAAAKNAGNGNAFTPVRALVTSSTAAVELNKTSSSSDTVLAATVTDDAVVQIDIYIYYEGSDTSVFTENFANLDGATIDFTFSVSATNPNAQNNG